MMTEMNMKILVSWMIERLKNLIGNWQGMRAMSWTKGPLTKRRKMMPIIIKRTFSTKRIFIFIGQFFTSTDKNLQKLSKI